jgi:hypothetical protein
MMVSSLDAKNAAAEASKHRKAMQKFADPNHPFVFATRPPAAFAIIARKIRASIFAFLLYSFSPVIVRNLAALCETLAACIVHVNVLKPQRASAAAHIHPSCKHIRKSSGSCYRTA